MLKMRKWMTEILLSVTSDELQSIATEVYKKERIKLDKGRKDNVVMWRMNQECRKQMTCV